MMLSLLPLVVALQTSAPVAEPQSLTGRILYVDDNAALGGDGAAWDSAYRYLQDALDAARQMPTVKEIHVGQGTYLPDHGANVQLLDQNASFHIVSGTALLGSYAGIGAQNPDERDFRTFPSLLSGDLLGNDQPNFVNYQDNSLAVTRATGTVEGTAVDGFILQGNGRTPGSTDALGAFNCEDGICVVRNCLLQANSGSSSAEASIISAKVTFLDCIFRENRALEYGGAIGLVAPFGKEAHLNSRTASRKRLGLRFFGSGRTLEAKPWMAGFDCEDVSITDC